MRPLRPLFLLTAFWTLFGTDAIAYDIKATNEDGVTLFYNWVNDKTELAVTHEGQTWVATESYKGAIRIPASVTYEGVTYPVTRIGNAAFYNCDELTSITIPSSVNRLSEGALGCCWKLESLFIPKTVVTIGKNAFMNDSSLISIVVEDGNPNYDSRNGCNAVIETATNTLLRGCRNTVFPDDIEAFGSYAMSNLGTIAPQTLPNTVKFIGEYAFLNCMSITSLTIPGSVKTIDKMAFNGCTGLSNLTLEKGIETLGGGAFQSCLRLTEVTLPVTIQSLGDNLFFNCHDLKTIKVLFSEPFDIAASTFVLYGSLNTLTLYVPKGCKAAFEAADHWKDFKEIIETNEEPELLDYFFTNVNGTKMYFKILDRDSKTVEIGLGTEPAIDTATSGDLVLPSEVKGYTVTGIATQAFAGCASLTSVTIPATITSIAGGAFSGNTTMTKVTYEGSPCPIDPNAFDADTYNGAKLVIDESQKTEFAKTQGWEQFISLVADLFTGDTFTDTTVEGIKVTYTVTSISPKTAKVGIDEYTRAVPSSAKGTVTIPSIAKGYTVTAIGPGPFAERKNVTEVILPPTITTLEDHAFANTALTYVTLPASVESIGTDIFYLSSKIAYIRMLSATPIAIKESVFPKRANLTLYVPHGSKAAYETAAYWKEFKEIVELSEDASDFLFPGSTFTSATTEGIDVLYLVTSVVPNTVKVASKSVDKGTTGSVTIPSAVKGYKVIGVSSNAFQDVRNVTQITLPPTVTTLDERAFYFCYAKEINIPEAVTAIPKEAFRYADITRITIPASVESIGSNAFYKCDDMLCVFMESAPPFSIPEDAFPTRTNVTLYVPYGSKAAYEITDYWKEFKEIRELPEDMTGILLPGSTFTSPTEEGVDVLYTVTSLSPNTVKVATGAVDSKTKGVVTIPSNVDRYEVTGIAYNAFTSVYNLKEIKLPSTITYFEGQAFYFCYAADINIPAGIKAIPQKAFYFSDIQRVTIPASVESIGSNAFHQCTDLLYVIMESTTPFSIPEDAFPTRTDVTLYVPHGSKATYEAADYWKDFKNIIELPEYLDGYLFLGDSFIEPTIEGNDVTYIVTSPHTVNIKRLDYSSKGIVTIPQEVKGFTVKEIANYGLSYHSGVTEFNLPSTLTFIGIGAFSNCGNMTHIIIPASVTSIDKDAFKSCISLKYVIVEGTTPATLQETSFPTRANITLYVPKGSKTAYQAADYWKEFKKIVEMQEGDVNGDEAVTITDAVAVVDCILGNPATIFIRQSADVNKDGNVNITDAVGIVDIILSSGTSSLSRANSTLHQEVPTR